MLTQRGREYVEGGFDDWVAAWGIDDPAAHNNRRRRVNEAAVGDILPHGLQDRCVAAAAARPKEPLDSLRQDEVGWGHAHLTPFHRKHGPNGVGRMRHKLPRQVEVSSVKELLTAELCHREVPHVLLDCLAPDTIAEGEIACREGAVRNEHQHLKRLRHGRRAHLKLGGPVQHRVDDLA